MTVWDLAYADPTTTFDQLLGLGTDGSDNLYLLDFDGNVFEVTDAMLDTALPIPLSASVAATLMVFGISSTIDLRHRI